jgi:DNA primase
MARLPQAFIDQVLDRTDIVDVVDRRVKLKKTGKNYSACCPFHQEKTPSFSVNPDKQFYYCFGCGAGGNALGFIMDYERLEFREAMEQLAHSAGMELPPDEEVGGAPKIDTQKPLYEAMEKATKYYEQMLRQHPARDAVVSYLKSRGLSGEIARDFRLGFAPEGWNTLDTVFTTEAEKQHAEKAGLLVRNDRDRVYDRFRYRVIFPIVNQRGKVIAMGGRVLGDDKPKYLNSPETPLFSKSRELYGLHHIRQFAKNLERIVVVEGYMDVIALAQFGIHYAVATLGTSVGQPHLEALFRRVDQVIFCFDGDSAGRKAAFRGLEAALPMMEDGRQVRFLFLPEGEDPDTLIREKGEAHFEHLLDTATPLEDFLFKELGDGIDEATMEGKARLSKVIAPYISMIPEGVFKALLYQSLADRTAIDVESLKRLREPAREPAIEMPADAGETMDDEGFPGYEALDDYDSFAATQRDPLPTSGQDTIVNETALLSRALGLITLNPALATSLDLSGLDSIDSEDAKLLRAVCLHIRENPDMTTPSLLGYWMGTPEGEKLSAYAASEVIDEKGMQAQLTAVIDKVARDREIGILRKRADELKSVSYTDLSDEQKRELVTLTQTIREKSGRG